MGHPPTLEEDSLTYYTCKRRSHEHFAQEGTAPARSINHRGGLSLGISVL